MSIQAIAWVLENSTSELADRLVLLAIANHADAHGHNAWPSVDQIAKEARVSRSTVFRCLHRLSNLGEVTVTSGGHGPGSTNTYQIEMEGSEFETLNKGVKGSQSETKRVSNCDKRVSPVNHKPSLTVLEPTTAGARVREAPPCADCLNGEGRLRVGAQVDPKTFEPSGGRLVCETCYGNGAA